MPKRLPLALALVLTLALALLCLSSASAHAQEDPDTLLRETMLITCSLDPATAAASTRIEQGAAGAERAATLQVARDKRAAKTMRVKAGEAAECVYPSGHRVRLKVGAGEARPYGRCGGDPELFLSLWVDGKKVQSRTWFAGFCREDSDEAFHVSYRIAGTGGRSAVQACRAPMAHFGEEGKPAATGRAACKALDGIAELPLDALEYPASGKRAVAGEIQRIRGTAPVCAEVQKALVRKFDLFGEGGEPPRSLSVPQWGEAIRKPFPEPLDVAQSAVFDFNNDGQPDRLFMRDLSTHYRHGTLLVVQPGQAGRALAAKVSLRDALVLPCQLDPRRPAAGACPPFGKQQDEAGPHLLAEDGQPLALTGRYTLLKPFRYQGTSYLGVGSEQEGSIAAVLTPQPSGQFEQTCVFRQVGEHF